MDIQRALDLREQGAQWNEIANELGVPTYTVRYNCDLAGIERRHYKDIDRVEVKALRDTGATWAAIECLTGYSRKHLQRLLRSQECALTLKNN